MQPGVVLGKKWIIKSQIGEGACAKVYTVESADKSLKLDYPLVAKCIDTQMRGISKDAKKEKERISLTLNRERQLLAPGQTLSKFPFRPKIPNLDFYGKDETNEVVYLVMEKLDQDLEQWALTATSSSSLTSSRSTSLIADIGLQLLEGFQFLHSKGLLFIDVKPQNFMLRGNDVVFIDYGLVERYLSHNSSGYREQTAKPFNGTPAFVSLAVHSGSTAAPKDDLESMCLVLLALGHGSGSLPWSHCKSNQECLAMKKDFDIATYANECGCNELSDIITMLRGLEYGQPPDYDRIKSLLTAMGTTSTSSTSASTITKQRQHAAQGVEKTTTQTSSSSSSAATAIAAATSTSTVTASKRSKKSSKPAQESSPVVGGSACSTGTGIVPSSPLLSSTTVTTSSVNKRKQPPLTTTQTHQHYNTGQNENKNNDDDDEDDVVIIEPAVTSHATKKKVFAADTANINTSSSNNNNNNNVRSAGPFTSPVPKTHHSRQQQSNTTTTPSNTLHTPASTTSVSSPPLRRSSARLSNSNINSSGSSRNCNSSSNSGVSSAKRNALKLCVIEGPHKGELYTINSLPRANAAANANAATANIAAGSVSTATTAKRASSRVATAAAIMNTDLSSFQQRKIGRSDAAEMSLYKDDTVSEIHAYILWTQSEEDGTIDLNIQDRGSTNGTRVNNIRLKSKTLWKRLFKDDLIELGHTIIQVT